MLRLHRCLLAAGTIAALPAALAGASSPLRAQADVRVIVHASVPDSELTREQLSRLFLKKVPRWRDGTPTAPVDLDARVRVRASFTELVHRRSVELLMRYWQRQLFSGRETPPPVVRSEADVLAFVRETPGAIGYVSAETELRAAPGVRVLLVRD